MWDNLKKKSERVLSLKVNVRGRENTIWNAEFSLKICLLQGNMTDFTKLGKI